MTDNSSRNSVLYVFETLPFDHMPYIIYHMYFAQDKYLIIIIIIASHMRSEKTMLEHKVELLAVS